MTARSFEKRQHVGKVIRDCRYLHRTYEYLLGDGLKKAKKGIPTGFQYEIVKEDRRTGVISFISSPDFDVADEPTVGDSFIVKPNGNVIFRRKARDPEIYHHKWLFVGESYEGFDVKKSQRRSLEWMSLRGIDRRRIGRKSYWEQYVIPRLTSGK